MTKLNASELKTLNVVARPGGFTFPGDSHFRSYAQGDKILKRMTKLGLLEIQVNDDKTRQWEICAEGRHFLKYGFTAAEFETMQKESV